MKNYFMRLIVLNIVFIVCNINAMKELSFLERSLNSFSDFRKFETKNIIDNRILIIGKFQNSKEMVEELQNIASELCTKTNKPILLCPNMEYSKGNYDDEYRVSIEHYTKESDIPFKGHSIPDADLRKLTKSELIIYLLHNQGLQVVPEDKKRPGFFSKFWHKNQLSDMWDSNNNAAPVVICVNQDCVPEGKMEILAQAVQEGNVKKFLNCLQFKRDEVQYLYEDADSSKQFSFNIPLKIFAIPLVFLLIGYVVYQYKK